MKKLKKDKTIYYTPLIVYKDHLHQIDMVFNDQSLKYSIEADGYIFDSIEEMLSNLKSIKKIFIFSKDHKIQLNLEPTMNYLKTSDYDNSDSISIFYKINDILEKCTIRPHFIFKFYYQAFTYLFFTVVIVVLNRKGLLSDFIDQ